MCVLFSLFYMQQEVRVEEETPEDNGRAAAAVTSDTEEHQEKELPPPAKRSCTLLENLFGPAFTNQGRNLYFLKCEVLHLAVG